MAPPLVEVLHYIKRAKGHFRQVKTTLILITKWAIHWTVCSHHPLSNDNRSIKKPKIDPSWFPKKQEEQRKGRGILNASHAVSTSPNRGFDDSKHIKGTFGLFEDVWKYISPRRRWSCLPLEGETAQRTCTKSEQYITADRWTFALTLQRHPDRSHSQL